MYGHGYEVRFELRRARSVDCSRDRHVIASVMSRLDSKRKLGSKVVATVEYKEITVIVLAWSKMTYCMLANSPKKGNS